MLMLNRTGPVPGKKGESLDITHEGETLRITVHRVTGNQVYLAIDGPLSFKVVRDDAVKQERV